jgi:3-hydroxy acid dehydrogenase/malonic semialdehyde reductase
MSSVNNAGFVVGVDRIGSINESEIDAMFATNVTGLIDMTQLLVKGTSISPNVSLLG